MSYLNYLKMHNRNTTNNIHSIIYETIFLSPIRYHFSLAIKEVFRRYTLYYNNIFYKNFYLIDLSSNEVILSLESIFDQNKNGDVEMKTQNKLIWNEIINQSHILKNDYIKKNKNIFQIETLQDFYIKLEFKATYPRCVYIIKFLPLLGGLSLVYEYSQNKMSHIENTENNVPYEEIKVNYGYEFDEENNFKTKDEEDIIILKEPDVLIHIHFYIIECLLNNLDNINLFIFNKYQKIYFSEEILHSINKHIYSNIKINQVIDIMKQPEFVHQLLEKIVNELYEEYLQINTQKEQSKYSSMVNKSESNQISLNKSFFLSYPDSLYISKKFTLNTIFKSGQLDHYINPNDISLNLSSEEETNITEDVYQTLRERNQYNQFNDPNFYNRFHYANASTESQRLMDLLNDNVTFNENIVLLNHNNRIYNDIASLNNTGISITTKNNYFNPYIINNNNGIVNTNLNNYYDYNNFIGNNNPNISSNSSHITSLLKMPKMKTK